MEKFVTKFKPPGKAVRKAQLRELEAKWCGAAKLKKRLSGGKGKKSDPLIYCTEYVHIVPGGKVSPR